MYKTRHLNLKIDIMLFLLRCFHKEAGKAVI